MDPALESFCAMAAAASDECALAAVVVDEAPLQSAWVGYYALRVATHPPLPDPRVPIRFKGAPSGFVEDYEEYARAGDPLLAQVAAAHSPGALMLNPLRNARKLPGSGSEPGFRLWAERYSEAQHYLLSPVIGDGLLVGTLNFVRLEDRPFGTRELGIAAAMSLHVSSRLSTLERTRAGPTAAWDGVLTPRDLDIAELVARGLTNAEAGRAVGISSNAVKKHLARMFAKLGVASRAELVRVLLLGPSEWMAARNCGRVP